VRLTGAEIVVRILIEQGVTCVFGYPGGAVLPIYDALYEHSAEITHYLTAHEQGAAHAADGYARTTGHTGVVLATSGPGATNLVTGIAAAFMDSVPLVAITGNVATPYIGKDSFQEVYTTGITLPITKHNFFVSDRDSLAATLREAFAIASTGRKGPVLVDITKDVQAAEGEWSEAPISLLADAPISPLPEAPISLPPDALAPLTPDALTPLRRCLDESSAPLICVGGGVVSADADAELRAFLARSGIPAVHSLMGIGALSPDDPLNLGLVGMHGRLSANRALEEADLLLTLGFRFSDRDVLNTENWQGRRIIQVDIDPSETNKNVEATHSIICDVREFLQVLNRDTATSVQVPDRDTAVIAGHRWESWRSRIAAWQSGDYHPVNDPAKLKPHQLMALIAELASDDAIITTDVGQHQIWAAQYTRRSRPRSFITSGGLGAMGFGYGAALGAQIGAGGGAHRARPVIHITGDGSFAMNLNEACTAVSYHLPVITVICNNHALGMVRQMQHAFYDDRFAASTLTRASDFVKLAEGFGLIGMRASDLEGFRAALSTALATDGPVWIECLIDSDEEALPLIPTGAGVDDALTA
jgi:acetolactate synthase-1/2/3 large subunit